MALTQAQLNRVRQLVNEKDTSRFSDQDIQDSADFVARMKDDAGRAPVHPDYVPTYDLFLLAAELWRVKAGLFAEDFDFRSEGAEFERSQKYTMALAQSKRYADLAAQRTSRTN